MRVIFDIDGVKKQKHHPSHLRIRAKWYAGSGERADFRNATVELYKALVDAMRGSWCGAVIEDLGEQK